ncbi:cyclodeaminase/cyclohydrolase family protein [Microbacterium sp. ET2]|uniref:cyclodeaminase/cyclohydrolase family protein n=1 Tax=Microbacterium albipurpureum TaxID=3050384 RepID=UPI00259CFD01|nr:cyclodeaminase/cyclohydrolase family protein [Microbacterium sp. ET2 (Ac-2212)]WJL94934.1 cyclodeaminase/cyclohydrolase family protein [Microbacterium sp. ET2 (Ac-2212)]
MSHDDIVPAETPLEEWLGRLAEARGAPGGGAACAVMTAISAALLGMVAAYTPDDVEAERAVGRLRGRRRAATRAAEEDGVRSAAFGASLAMSDGPERERAVRQATVEAIESSLSIGRIGVSLLDDVRLLADIGNRHVEADLRVAAEALRAALEGAHLTAEANLDLLERHRTQDDQLDPRVEEFHQDLAELAEKRSECDSIATHLRSR